MTAILPSPSALRNGWRHHARSLRRSESGMALVEFAMVLPFLMILTTSALELTNYAITVKRVGELGVMVSDNASRMQLNGDGGQTIKWQRCFGAVNYASAYGTQGTGATGTSFAGMGPTGKELKAAAGTAVMFVEIRYRYKRLMPLFWLPLNDITETSAFNVRDSRDLTQVYNSENVTASTCS